MTSSRTAQGLASLGRNGDSMLMHVSPSEVRGLKQAGDSLGIKMTINPHTGMPEAFKFGRFLSSFLPTIAGIMAAPATGGASLAPILAGAGTGAVLAAAQGQDPLMGGLTGGLGGYGGGNLAGTFGKAFGSAGGTTAGAMDDIIAAGAQQTTGGAGNVGMFTAGNMGAGAGVGPQAAFGQAGTYAQAVPNLGVTANTPNPFTGAGGFDPAAKAVAGGGGYSTAPLDLVGDNISNLGSGVKNLTGFGDMSIGDAYGKFTQAGGSAMDLAMPVGTAVLSGMEPQTYTGYQDPEKGKYRGPEGQLNLSDRFDTGLRLVAKGGYIDGYATGGTIQSGGIRDLYGTPDNQPTISPGLSGFGLGRLNNLAGEQAMTQAQTLGYADGGDVGGGAVNESAPNPEGVVSKYTTVVDDKGVSSRVRVPYQYEKIITKGAEDFYDIPPIEYAANLYPGSILPKFKKEGYADGGDVGMNIEKQQPLNLDRLPSLNVETGTANYMTPDGSGMYAGKFFKDFYRQNPTSALLKAFSNLPNDVVFNKTMAKGGYLNGQGDGMSDSIPATIEGKQPARLADGEFVIPADVVSHLGNGSSKAGSKRLYAMLDKIRHARTGTKKQGKQINPAKYMPA